MSHKGIVLLVEDDTNILRTNRRILEREGYIVLSAETLAKARMILKENIPDALVLDIMLPDGDGLTFCREIRPTTSAPVLFLTALDAKSEVVEGLIAGGNDYITKPYDVDEFVARIEAQIRLARMNRENTGGRNALQRGPLVLDFVSSRAFLNETDMVLSPREFAMLHFFLKNEGKIVSSKQIYEAVWNQPMAKNASALWKCISRLKRKLEISNGYVTLTNYRNQGYAIEINEPRNKRT